MKIDEFIFEESDIITTDRYLEFCNLNNICYVKTDFFYIGQFNWRGTIHPTWVDKFCVIGHSDYPITDEISNHLKTIFCINKFTNNPNTHGIPLGVCNFTNESHLHQIFGKNKDLVEVSRMDIEKSNLVYLNFNINNYPPQREMVWNLFSQKSWVYKRETLHSDDGRRRYLEDIKSSKFVFCPRGNGVDTHRIWETMYMGSIPIVKYEITHESFTDLPILFIENWNEISDEFLEESYKKIVEKNWNLDKLKVGYWTNLIHQEFTKIKNNNNG
jgi:hypothetical protein